MPTKPRECRQLLYDLPYGKGFRARCTEPWGVEHSHSDHTAAEAVELGLARPEPRRA